MESKPVLGRARSLMLVTTGQYFERKILNSTRSKAGSGLRSIERLLNSCLILKIGFLVLNLANSLPTRALGGLLLILLAALTSCGGGSGDPNQGGAVPPTGGGGTVEPPPKGLLVALESPDEFKQKIAAGFNTGSSERAAALGDGTGSSDGLNGGSDGGSGGDTDGGSGDDTGGGGDTGGETDGGDFGGDGVPMGDASGGTETVAFTTTYTLRPMLMSMTWSNTTVLSCLSRPAAAWTVA